jgi:DNA-binding NarL/FixJ family response regulator
MADVQPASIVLIDDHAIVEAGLRFLLADSAEFRIAGVARDGAAALPLVRRLRPELVILDLVLPGKSGLAVLRDLKTGWPDGRILVVSGQATGLAFKRALDGGADGVVSKSEPPAVLLAALCALRGGERYLSAAIRALIGPIAPAVRPADADAGTLTWREREVLRLIAAAHTSQEIAGLLGIAEATVKKHRQNLMRKLGVHSAVDAARRAYALGLVSLS